MPLTQTVAPAAEPVSLTELKSQARVDISDDDTLLSGLITAARQMAESMMNRSLITQTWRLTLDAFPQAGMSVSYVDRPYSLPGNAILLERAPIQSVTSITYKDMAGVTQTMSASDYATELNGDVGRITPPFGKIWPIPLPQIGSVNVTFVAGYGASGASVPQPIKQAVLILATHLYQNREMVSYGRWADVPMSVTALLDPYVVKLS